MAYSFILEARALKELTEAFLWYEEQQEGLGVSFRTKFHVKLAKICNNPFHYRTSYKKFGEALTDTFPYQIVYTVNEKENLIIVIAIFHTSRNPKRKFKS